MSNLEQFRGNIHKTLLDSNHESMEELYTNAANSGDQDEIIATHWFKELYLDFLRYQKNNDLEGYHPRHNPFARLSLDYRDNVVPVTANDLLDATHHTIVRTYSWLGIGYWSLAEEYAKNCISLATIINNVTAALQGAVNLALCYLGAKDIPSVILLCQHVLPYIIESQNFVLLKRVVTIYRVALIIKNDSRNINKLKKDFPDTSNDSMVNSTISGIYAYQNNKRDLMTWNNIWQELDNSKS
jgi:hypothetical protein